MFDSKCGWRSKRLVFSTTVYGASPHLDESEGVRCSDHMLSSQNTGKN